jgi:CRISPR-associated protein Cas6
MKQVDLSFPVMGTSLSSDHGYDLYAALARIVPKLHSNDVYLRIAPIRGTYEGEGTLQLSPRFSRLRLRLPAEEIPSFLVLAGKELDIGGHRIGIGVPNVLGLIPAPAVSARLVTIKGFQQPALFLEAVRRQLAALEIRGEPGIPLISSGPRQGQARRRVLRVRDKKVVGFAVQVTELTAEESIRLQESGLGGRGKMGCGFFGAMLPR